jgi:hypothetical protein
MLSLLLYHLSLHQSILVSQLLHLLIECSLTLRGLEQEGFDFGILYHQQSLQLLRLLLIHTILIGHLLLHVIQLLRREPIHRFRELLQLLLLDVLKTLKAIP